MDRVSWDVRSARRYLNYCSVLGCVVLLGYAIFAENGYLALRRRWKEVGDRRQKVLLLQRENEQLEKQNRALQSDPEAILAAIRNSTNYVFPGQTVYAGVNPETKSDQQLQILRPKERASE
jgi:cell division protein FtsB